MWIIIRFNPHVFIVLWSYICNFHILLSSYDSLETLNDLFFNCLLFIVYHTIYHCFIIHCYLLLSQPVRQLTAINQSQVSQTDLVHYWYLLSFALFHFHLFSFLFRELFSFSFTFLLFTSTCQYLDFPSTFPFYRPRPLMISNFRWSLSLLLPKIM